eukprot:6471959-Amphidinium_carterae.1
MIKTSAILPKDTSFKPWNELRSDCSKVGLHFGEAVGATAAFCRCNLYPQHDVDQVVRNAKDHASDTQAGNDDAQPTTHVTALLQTIHENQTGKRKNTVM